MATEAATGQPANVQAYLGKHSIATLFEDLTALLVKELPDNPIDFLVLKLQAKKKRATGTARSTATSTKKLDVTGITPTKTERSKLPARSTSGGIVKPVKPSSRPTSGQTSKPNSSVTRGPTATRSATSLTKTSTKPVPKPVTSIGAKKPSTVPPPSKHSIGKPTAPSATSTRKPIGKTSGIPTKGGATPTKPISSKKPNNSPSVVRKAPKPVAVVTESPPPQKDESVVTSKDVKDDDEELLAHTNAIYNDSEEEEENHHYEEDIQSPVELNNLISQIRRSKDPHKHNKPHLASLINAHAATISEGYISDSEHESDEEEELEVVESIDALEEEGVYLTGEARRMSLKLPSIGPTVDLQVQVCARCAKILSREEESTIISSSTVSKLTSIDEFESASQVVTSDYPQWDTEESGSMTVKQKWSVQPLESSSISSTSHDTWKGLAPPTRQEESSEDESDLKLPIPVDYHKPEETPTEEELIDIED